MAPKGVVPGMLAELQINWELALGPGPFGTFTQEVGQWDSNKTEVREKLSVIPYTRGPQFCGDLQPLKMIDVGDVPRFMEEMVGSCIFYHYTREN